MKKRIWLCLCLLISFQALASKKQLHQAVVAGDLAQVEAELKDGTNPNKEYKKQLPLVVAIDLGQRDIAELLLKHGADINGVQDDGETPLTAALNSLQLDWVQALIEKGAAIKGSKKSMLPLHRAAELADVTLFETLRNKGADPNQLNKNGESPLFPAVRSGALGFTKHLLSVGLDINLANDNGETPLLVAVQENDLGMAKFLLQKGADKTARDKTSKNALTWAALVSDAPMVALLTGLGVDYEVKDNLNYNAISYVSFFNAKTKIEAMQAPLEFMGSPFQQAILLDDLKSLAQLLTPEFSFGKMDCGDVCHDESLKYPLIFAIHYGSIESIKMLFDHAGPVDGDPSNISTTPLVEAVKLGRGALARYLLARGAGVERCSGRQVTPLANALKEGRRRIAYTLWQAGARVFANAADGSLLRFKDGPFEFNRLHAEYQALSKQWQPSPGDQPPICVSKDEVYDEACKDIVQPVITGRVPPRYPALALQNKIRDAKVTLDYILDKDGTIRDFRIIESVGNYRLGFEFETIQAIKQWKFVPASLNGEPISVKSRMVMNFELRR